VRLNGGLNVIRRHTVIRTWIVILIRLLAFLMIVLNVIYRVVCSCFG